jgi:hypothetical protein
MGWYMLGRALAWQGESEAAIASLNRWIELRNGSECLDRRGFDLAVAYNMHGDRERARQWFDRGGAWVARYGAADPAMLLLRDEVAELLGMPGWSPGGKK